MKLLQSLFIDCTNHIGTSDLTEEIARIERATKAFNVSIVDIAGSEENWNRLIKANDGYTKTRISQWVDLHLVGNVDATDNRIAEFLKSHGAPEKHTQTISKESITHQPVLEEAAA